MSKPDAATVVANELARRSPGERSRFLTELMVHAAAGRVVLDGPEAAAESAYRLADSIVSRMPLQ